MSDMNIAIDVNSVHKQFKLPHEKHSTIKAKFINSINRKNKNYSTQKALKGVSFSIKKGEFFGIVGRNGSGKSTLLKILAGIYQPTKGTVSVHGKLVPFIELGVGFNPELTGRENVYLNGALLNFSKREVDGFYDEVVSFAELEEFMDQKLKNYSSGMQVRLAFSMAIQAKADILLVDEVLAVGDADFQRKCFDYFRSLKKQNTTVVFVSHDMNAVREFCDRAVLINGGKVVSEGASTKVSNEYTKLFINNHPDTNKSNDSRSGTGLALIGKYNKRIIIKEKTDNIPINFDVIVNENIDNLAVGFRLKSSDDKHLFGTNNIIQERKLINLKKGDKLDISFRFANILNNGTYFIDLALESADGEIFDWIIDAITIESMVEKKTGYLIDPEVNMEIKNV
jgi:ABC-2 type transport system ATP-binding protein